MMMSGTGKYRTGFELNVGSPGQEKQMNKSDINTEDPLYITVLGDFSGRDNAQNYDVASISKRRFVEVDRDNLNEILASFKLNLRLCLDDAAEPVVIPINEFDDFHPDRLFENVDVFSQLRSLLRRFKNKNTFAEAAAELQNWLDVEVTESKPPGADNTELNLSGERLLDTMLTASQGQGETAASGSGNEMVDKLVKQIVAPYVEPKADPRQDEMIEAVEQAISAHMQFILHHPDFQEMESAWTSLDFLMRRVETGRKLKIFIMDVAKHELEVDLSEDDLTQTQLYKRFCDPAPGDVPWGLLIGNYRFNDRVEEIMTLLHVGAIARKAKAPFITSANETLIGCESFAVTPDIDDWEYNLSPEVETAWSLLRDSDEAEYLSIVVPRFLLRQPYGKKSRPIESFPFEEMPKVHCHSCYLWGNGAFIKAEQITRGYSQSGWDMNPAETSKTEKLPLHFFELDGETMAKPCAEIQLTERGGQRILQRGLIPLWSVKNSDSIRSSDFHSLAL